MKLKFTSLSKTLRNLLIVEMTTLCLTSLLLTSNMELRKQVAILENRPVEELEFKSIRSIYTEMPQIENIEPVIEEEPVVEESVEIVEEPVEPVEIVEEPIQATSSVSTFSEDEIYLMAKVCLAEAEDQTEYGKRLVVSTILNRLDSGIYGDTIYDVVYAPYQFEVMMNGRIDRVEPDEYTLDLVRQETISRSNYDVIYFRMDYYSEYGTPLFVEDDHYFSGF